MKTQDDDVDISNEEILGWIQEDRDGIVERVRKGLPGEEIQRMGRWTENMEDRLTRPFQERLNDLCKQLQIQRKKLGTSREEVAAALGIETETLRYLEHGWTDPTELGSIIKNWADLLQLEGNAFLEAIPGPTSQRNIF